MPDPISRLPLQYDIRELPESWYPLLTGPIVYSRGCLLSYQSSSIWTVCFPISFGMTVAPEFYCTVQVIHIMPGASGGKRPWRRAIPAAQIRSNRSNSIFAKVSVSKGVQVRVFDKLPTTFATKVVKVFPDESSLFSSHRQNHKWDKLDRVSWSDSSTDWTTEVLSSILYIKALPNN